MPPRFRLLAAALLTAACASAPPAVAPGGMCDLQVRVGGIPQAGGRVAVALYADAASFEGDGEPLRRAFLDGRGGQVDWRLDDLPCGVYAVKAYLDADGDGELDKGALGAPSEPYGFSRRARGRFGPPSFAAAAVVVGEPGLVIAVTVE